MTLPPTYNPKEFEDKIYQQWQSEGVGSPEVQVHKQITKPKVLFATTNANKIDVFTASFEKLGLNKKIELLTLKDFPEIKNIEVDEPGLSFENDALIKARTYSKLSGIPTISQDRGFVFEALNWPGTKSKLVMDGDEKAHVTFRSEADKPLSTKEKHRENSESAIEKLVGIEDRTMNIYQALAICFPDGQEFVELHKCEGIASFEVVDTNDSSMASFFVPKGYSIPMGGWSEAEIFEFDVNHRYPITQKIVEFMATKLQNDTYSTLMPPPNLTGGLHAGHAFQHYLMDTLTRVHRQKGQKSLWYPGVDHAGIQLEGVIDKLIKKSEFDDVLKEYGAEEVDE